MPSSTVSTYQITRNELIEAALRKIGVLAEGVSANATQLTTGQQAANLAIKHLQTKGMQAWVKTTIPITFTALVSSYNIGEGQTVNVPYPLKIEQAYLEDSSGSLIDLELESSYNFNLLPTNAEGTPVKVTYNPNINVGVLRVWPKPTSEIASDYTLKIISQAPFKVFTSASETLDFSEEWQLPLVYLTASFLADDYQLPIDDRRYIKNKADEYILASDMFGVEDTSSYFYPRTS